MKHECYPNHKNNRTAAFPERLLCCTKEVSAAPHSSCLLDKNHYNSLSQNYHASRERTTRAKPCVLERPSAESSLSFPTHSLRCPHFPAWAAPWLQWVNKPNLLQLQVCSWLALAEGNCNSVRVSSLRDVCSPGLNSRLSFPPPNCVTSVKVWETASYSLSPPQARRKPPSSRPVAGRGPGAC